MKTCNNNAAAAAFSPDAAFTSSAALSSSSAAVPRAAAQRAARRHADHLNVDPRAGRNNLIGALALTFGALALTLAALNANAEITQDCIIEGTVDMRRAEQLGQPYYVSFSNIRRGTEANCSMTRRNKSRRVQFADTPRMDGIENAVDGSKVRYRYIERDGQPGQWQLIEVSDPRGGY